MNIRIDQEDPRQPAVRELIEALNAHLLPLSPLEFQFKMTADEMVETGTTVFVARNDSGLAIGIGALKVHSSELGEVKRMFTRPEVRGQRVGVALLDAITDLALNLGLDHLVLETGDPEAFAEAHRLYTNAGFTRCGPVLDYPDSRWSAFFEKPLRVGAKEGAL